MSYDLLPDGRVQWTSTFRIRKRYLSDFYDQMDESQFEWCRDNSDQLMEPIQEIIDELVLVDYQITNTTHTEKGIEFVDSLVLTARLSDSQMLMLRLMES